MNTRTLLLAILALVFVCAFTIPAQSSQAGGDSSPVASIIPTPLAQATVSITLDTSTATPGQVAIADIITYSGGRISIYPPVGWTLIQDDPSLSTRQTLYWHTIGPSERDDPTWTFSEPLDTQGSIILLNNINGLDPVDVSGGNVVAGQVLAPSIKTSGDGELLMAFFATDPCGPTVDQTPTGMTMVATPDTTDGHQYAIYVTEQSARGDTGDAVCPNAEGFNWVAQQLALRRTATTASAGFH